MEKIHIYSLVESLQQDIVSKKILIISLKEKQKSLECIKNSSIPFEIQKETRDDTLFPSHTLQSFKLRLFSDKQILLVSRSYDMMNSMSQILVFVKKMLDEITLI